MSTYRERYLSAINEIYITLSPLGGFFKSMEIPPSFDFDAAMAPIVAASIAGLIDISFDELETLIALTKLKMQEIYDSGQVSYTDVPFAAGCAILMYTAEGEFFVKFNEYLRESSRQSLKYFIKYIWLLEYGLMCAPKYLGTSVFRGIKGTHIDYNPKYPFCFLFEL